MKEWSGIKTYAIWFILLMFIPLLGHRKILTAQRQAIAAVNEKNSGFEKVLRERKEILDSLNARHGKTMAAEKQIHSFFRGLVQENLVPDVLDGLGRVAAAAGITLLGATHSRTSSENGRPPSVDFELSFTGSLAGMMRFVSAVDILEVPVKVVAVKAADKSGVTAGTVSCRVLTGGM